MEKQQSKLIAFKKPKITKKELDNTLNRLYKADVKKREEKQKMLKKLFVPTFKPRTNYVKEVSKNTEKEIEEKNNDENDNEIIMNDKIVEETQKIMSNVKQEKIETALRNRLFVNKKFIIKTK